MFGRINFAVMGAGNIASTMADTVRKIRGVRCYAVASRSADKAAGFAAKHGFKKAYGSYEELVNDKKVSLIYVATPHSEHYANAKLCIEHGKSVIVEKPFCVNAGQARELFALAEEKHVFITEAMWTRYMPFAKTIREVIDSRVVGDPVMLSAELSYPIRGVQRLTDPMLAGGALLDLGVYPLTFASMFFGDDIARVKADCTFTPQHVDEQDSITLVYKDGKMAVLRASMLGTGDRRGVITFTKGYMVVENINNFESLTVYGSDYKKLARYKRPRQKTGYEYEIMACVRALREGWTECPELPHEETLRMMELLDEIRRQYRIVYPFEEGARQVPLVTAQAPDALIPDEEAQDASEQVTEEQEQPVQPSSGQPREEAAESVVDTPQEQTAEPSSEQEQPERRQQRRNRNRQRSLHRSRNRQKSLRRNRLCSLRIPEIKEQDNLCQKE